MDLTDSQPASNNVPIERIDSGDTDDSPFCSNLVTPTDDQNVHLIVKPQLHDGIDEKIMASLDYFTSGRKDTIENGLQENSVGTTTLLEPLAEPEAQKSPLVGELEPVSLSQTSESPIAGDASGDVSHISTLDSNQTLPSSHPSLAELVDQARRSSSALYNLPNSHIFIDHEMLDSESEAEGDVTVLPKNFLEDSKQPTPDLLFTLSWPEDLSMRTLLSNLTIHSLYSLACQILLFFPWCIAVGAAIIVSPTNLSSIAFAPSVNYISRPPTPVELFAHWADYGLQHITIFAGFIFSILWKFPNPGTILLGALCAQFCWSWHDFLPEQTTALGEDERQMVYQLARSAWLTGNTVGIKKVNGKYYATDTVDPEFENNGVDSDSESESDCGDL